MTHPSGIYEDMKTAGAELRKAIDSLAGASAQAVVAEHKFQIAWDEAFVAAEGSEQNRKSLANIATAELREQSNGLKAQERIVKQSINAWQSILSSLQSLATAYREEAKFARSSGDIYH